jgi:hypothetical protein
VGTGKDGRVRATIFHGAGDVRVEEVPDPRIEAPTDIVARITHACICGSDLWPYRGYGRFQAGWRIGHEWMGIVEDVGADVRTIRPGDRVVAPFSYSDGTCAACREGVPSSCESGGGFGGREDGGQAEAVRCRFADATLVKVPEEVGDDEALLAAVLPLTDVMATGHHAAVAAGVRAGGTAVVVGDGAVGLCGVLAARRIGAERIISLGHHEDRLAIARRFGATDVVTERGDEAVSKVKELTGGGAESVLECVGNQVAMDTAIGAARPGGRIGYVGVPHGVDKLNLRGLFSDNITLAGGVAPVRVYLEELLADVVAGTLDPSPVFDLTVDLDGVPDAYAAMDGRRALKAMVRP